MAVDLNECLKALRLPAVRDCYQDMADTARMESHSYEQYLKDHHNTATMFQTGEINTGSFRGGGAVKVNSSGP